MLRVATSMFDDDNKINPDMPAGYTYLGQFIVHDISFDTTSISERQIDPEFLSNFRTPAVDLDSVYGGGPSLSPYFYDPDENYGMTHFLLPKKRMFFGTKGQDPAFYDLPRTSSKMRTAIIADPRNDENIVISQIHAAFLQLHNVLVDHFSKLKGMKGRYEEQFRMAQNQVRWYFQWIILFDYLPRVVDLSQWNKIKNYALKDSPHTETTGQVRGQIKEVIQEDVERKFYKWRNERFIPLEFSAAAFRFGHSQVRRKYQFNRDPSRTRNSRGVEVNSQAEFLFTDEYFRSKTPFIRVSMPMFFPKPESETFVSNKLIGPSLAINLSNMPMNLPSFEERKGLVDVLKEIKEVKERLGQRLDEKLRDEPINDIIDTIFKDTFTQLGTDDLRKFLLDATIRINEANLAERNLIRGLMLRLPSGQSVAKAMGLDALTIEGKEGFPEHLVNNTPLWYYILYEAEKEKQGKRLGPVGSRIVAEVIIGLIQGDKTSFLNQDPNWRPMKKVGKELVTIAEDESFVMADLLEIAGVYT